LKGILKGIEVQRYSPNAYQSTFAPLYLCTFISYKTKKLAPCDTESKLSAKLFIY